MRKTKWGKFSRKTNNPGQTTQGTQKVASVRFETFEDFSPLKERKKSYTFEGRWMGHGIEEIDVDVAIGGQITGSTFINRMEASALDGLFRAGVFDDPKDEEAAIRRRSAGIFLRKVFHDAEIEPRCVGQYDKVLNEMMGGSGQHPKSQMAQNSEVDFFRLMRLSSPYNEVIRDVCCLNERPPEVVRIGLRTPCHWKEALCRGLDLIAEDTVERQERAERHERKRRREARKYRVRAMERPVEMACD
jgi:hypothetical protein